MRAIKVVVMLALTLACGACANMPRVWCADPNIQAQVPIIECLAPEA